MLGAVSVALSKPRKLGKRAQNRLETRRALVSAAHELFAAHGFDEVRVDDIASKAGIGRRTFFRYFASKADVAFPDHAARIERFSGLMRMRLPHETALAAVQRALVVLGNEMMANADEVLAQQAIVDASPTLLAAERVLDREWDLAVATALAGEDTPGVHERIVAGALLGAVRATIRTWFDSGGACDLVELGLAAFALLGEGLGADGGQWHPKIGT